MCLGREDSVCFPFPPDRNCHGHERKALSERLNLRMNLGFRKFDVF